MIRGVKLVRIDYRLIHGQVITKWSHIIHTTQIVVVNDELLQDEFMADIYVMAAPPDVTVDVTSKRAFAASAKKGRFEEGNILVLFKSIEDCARVVDEGVSFASVQVGGLGHGGGRTSVVRGISIDARDAELLSRIAASGAEVTFQVQPEEPRLTLDQARKKL